MKRQVGGNRKSADESEKNEANENKRIKLLHDKHEGNLNNMQLEEGAQIYDTLEQSIHGSEESTEFCQPLKSSAISSQESDQIQCYNNDDGVGGSQDSLTTQLYSPQEDLDSRIQEDSMQSLPVLDNYSPVQKNGNHDSHENGIHESSCEGNFHEDELANLSSTSRRAKRNISANDSISALVPPNIMQPECLPQLEKISDNGENLNHGNQESVNVNGSLPDIFGQTNSSQLNNLKKEDVTSSPQKCASDSSKSDLKYKKMCSFDIENIMLSHLEVTQLEGHADVVYSVAADGDIVLSSSGDTTIKVWNVEEKREIGSFAGHSGAVMSVILLTEEQSEKLCSKLNVAHSRIAVSSSLDCHVKLWSLHLGQELLSFYTFNGITCIGYLESEFCIVVGTEGGKLEVWDLCTAKSIQSIHAHGDCISDLKVERNYVYSTSVDGTIKVWLFEEDELQPLYTRRRKERLSTDKNEFGPTQWKAVAAHDNILYLGDNSSDLKVLDWGVGRLRLYKNLTDDSGICEAVLATKNILLTAFYDSTSDIGGINVWRLPELSYVCTLTGNVQEICSLAMTSSEESLRIVSGGHQLLVWDFDFTRPPKKNSREEFFYVCEIDNLGAEIDEKPSESGNVASPLKSSSNVNANSTGKTSWCNVM